MRKFVCGVLLCAMLICLAACGQKAPTWQEQYDLGVRYLSEGNYEEAIIAFTAAIDIDPKQAPAYVGRGDAYIGSGETEENLAAAQTNYEKAIELDETNVEAYLGLANVHIYRENYEKAIEILKQGLESTENDSRIADKLVLLEELVASSNDPSSTSDKVNKSQSGETTEAISIPLMASVIESEGDIQRHLKPLYELIIENGQYYGGQVSVAQEDSTTILYGNLDVQCGPLILGNSYMVRGGSDTDLQRLKENFALFCPPQYIDSTDSTMESLHYGSYDELFKHLSQLENHGGGWSNSSFIDENEWFLAVACYNSFGDRMGYVIYQISDVTEIEHIRKLCMVTINNETGGLVS